MKSPHLARLTRLLMQARLLGQGALTRLLSRNGDELVEVSGADTHPPLDRRFDAEVFEEVFDAAFLLVLYLVIVVEELEQSLVDGVPAVNEFLRDLVNKPGFVIFRLPVTTATVGAHRLAFIRVSIDQQFANLARVEVLMAREQASQS